MAAVTRELVPPRRAVRPEIQGLRAVAVLLVVGYHLFPHHLRGGYVGVDVFFVISGYLITGQIMKEVVSTGRLSLLGFWGRRVRRLLPAALLVLTVCLALTWLFAPTALWSQWLGQISASALYVENWVLAADAVDYLAQGNAPSIVQHFWSLSVEEQFYIVWPILVVLVLVALRWARHSSRNARVALIVLATISVASLVWSVAQTNFEPGIAYFSTATRIWEFGAGALLVFLPAAVLRAALRYLLGWAGLAAIALAGILFTAATPFPGYAALLPVAGAAAVIVAGGPDLPRSAASLLSIRPAVFIGDISYSTYLWHWPLIIIAPYATGLPLTLPAKAGVVVLTLALAWASTTWVERPLRHLPALSARRWRSFAAGVVAMALVVGGSLSLQADLQGRLDAARAAEQAAAEMADQTALEAIEAAAGGTIDPGAAVCLGPAALDPNNGCSSAIGAGEYLVPPAVVGSRSFEALYPGCMGGQDERKPVTCEVGETVAPTRTIALVGDSHATHWVGAFDVLGRALHWRVIVSTKASCPFIATDRLVDGENGARIGICREVSDEVLDELTSGHEVDAVFTSAFGSAYGWDGDPAEGLSYYASALSEVGIPLIVLRDVPRVKDRANSPACLQSTVDVLDCSLPRGEALVPDAYSDIAASVGLPVIDLTDQFCDATWCYAVVGGVVVYVDYSHLSSEYSALLAPAIFRDLLDLGDSGVPGL